MNTKYRYSRLLRWLVVRSAQLHNWLKEQEQHHLDVMFARYTHMCRKDVKNQRRKYGRWPVERPWDTYSPIRGTWFE